MERYQISPEDCLILKAFKEASTLREAAKLLSCDPAGLLRKVQRISSDFGYLQKTGGHWRLTATGVSLAAWTEETIKSQKQLLLQDRTISIASTTWLSERLITKHLSQLDRRLDSKYKFHLKVPEKNFENFLKEGETDFVIVCHPPEDPSIAHKQVCEEEWAAAFSAQLKRKIESPELSDLIDKPFIRHSQMNPEIFLSSENAANLKIHFHYDHLIGVRSAIVNDLGWSFVPKILISQEINNKEIYTAKEPIKMNRKVCVWWLRQRIDLKNIASHVCQWVGDSCKKEYSN